MNWTKLTKENIPTDECLAINESGDILVGYIYLDRIDYKTFYCDSDETQLKNVVAYITHSELLTNYKTN